MNTKSINSILKLGMLFIAKTGGILVGVYFLPLFNQLLGTEQFGIVAIILSLQALLLSLDFGMATLVGRDVAARTKLSYSPSLTWRNAEAVMSLVYIAILSVFVLWWWIQDDTQLAWLSVIGIVILFWSLMLQNIALAALFGADAFIAGSVLQFIGVLVRAIVTVMCLENIAASIDVFILSQVIVSLIHLSITRYVCSSIITFKDKDKAKFKFKFRSCMDLALRGKSLIFLGIAGALVMQLDKMIIANFISAVDLVPYFLAFTFSMTPVLALAGPVKQYFQPRYISLQAEVAGAALDDLVNNFVLVMMFVTVIPVIILWIFREYFIRYWLGENDYLSQVIEYSAVLLPGFAIGAVGYIPVVFLTAAQDFKFQAKLSSLSALLTLFLVLIFSLSSRIDLICYVYSLYFISMTVFCWIRAINVISIKNNAINSLVHTIRLLLIIIIISLIFVFGWFLIK